MGEPFVEGAIAGGLLVLAAVAIVRFARRDGRDLTAPPAVPPAPAIAPPPNERPRYDANAVAAIADALNRGQKLEAIKLLREATGMGLAEAKAAVEDMERKLRA